ncbi:hypothetical protein M441DRAFT_261213 [Trichoderma asperellum CBS 433.97]|uniref:C2H2-type domain-containing protein n=1 Tax=Trichoderma asperellum (strain ATCC 204424 / CBS 433.97 / NBRC 101777) TaxID=1042311 RepID=A0A2T3YWY2_TRIA4|nr:hypothetical protein M441DRAFT_261213 [Trichoderma asperellum CBS 433.97]PTB37056.1 hypothetical protein M441DRAFT_261213 [Trichoderma asperellum CBS 433.97]
MQGEASRMAPEDTTLECYVEALPPYQSIVLSTQPRPQIGTRREATMMIGMDISKGRQPILDDKSNTTLEHFYRPLHCNPVPSSAPTTSLKCPHPACQSKVLYTRKCDLEKHYRSHFRKYFCRISECSLCEMNSLTVSGSGYSGFATRKDRDRHERSHFPALSCKCCGKVFSRLDNLRDHWRKRHSETTFPM